MATLNKGRPLDDKAFERAKSEVIEIICAGLPRVRADLGAAEADVKTHWTFDAFPAPGVS
jgi:hypothetical protein